MGMYSNDPGLNARICRDHDKWLLKGLPDGEEQESTEESIESLLDTLPKVIQKDGENYPLWIHPTTNDPTRNYWYVSYKLGCDQLYQTSARRLSDALYEMRKTITDLHQY